MLGENFLNFLLDTYMIFLWCVLIFFSHGRATAKISVCRHLCKHGNGHRGFKHTSQSQLAWYYQLFSERNWHCFIPWTTHARCIPFSFAEQRLVSLPSICSLEKCEVCAYILILECHCCIVASQLLIRKIQEKKKGLNEKWTEIFTTER